MSLLATLDRATTSLRRALKTADSLQLDLDLHPEYDEIPIQSERLGLSLRETAILLYMASTEIMADGFSESDTARLYQEKLCPSDQVAACLTENAIHIRLPMLGNRQSRSQNYVKDTMFADDVRYAIRSAPEYDAYDFSRIQNKIITVLFLYDSESARRGWIADSDNHEIKYVLDAVSSYLPGGDSPLTTAIFLTTAVSDKLQKGTYICVSCEKMGVQKAEDLMEYWIEKQFRS